MPKPKPPPPLFSRPPDEVLRYVRTRFAAADATDRWTELAAHRHALAFTVARTAGYAVLDDLKAAVETAILENRDFESFSKELEPILRAKGWWGPKRRRSSDGGIETVELGSTRRLRTIYNANMASAYAAGEWARIQRTKDVLPYLRYALSLSERRRQEHIGWVGTTLPVDHPWWRTHFPPNGWNCKCRVEQVGDYVAERMPPGKRQAPPTETRLFRDRRSGAVWRVPKGIDPGWQHHPGRTQERVAAINLRLAERRMARSPSPEALHAKQVLQAAQHRSGPVFHAIVNRNLGYDSRRVTEPEMRSLGEVSAPIAALPPEISETQDMVVLKAAIAVKQGNRHPELSGINYDIVQEILDRPTHLARTRDLIEVSGIYKGREWFTAIRIDTYGATLLTLYVPKPQWLSRFKRAERTRDKEGG